MRVGLGATFQNPGREYSDRAVYENELRLARQAEPAGFDGIWTVEHHFSGYQMCTSPLQFLTYMAGITERIELGAMCVVLPWHDPLRVVEEAIALDHYSGGRLTLGIARGAGKEEFAGFKVDMNKTRPQFVEYAEMVLGALETGVAEYQGDHLVQPRVELRPEPYGSFRRRTYCGAVSPESMDIMAKLGVGMLITPSKPWDQVASEMREYRDAFRRYHGDDPVPTIANGWIFVDESEERAHELGRKWLKRYWGTVLGHYGFNKPENFRGVKGYEHYVKGAEIAQQVGDDAIEEAFCDFHFYGTPEQVYEKVANVHAKIGCRGFNGIFRYAGMSYEEGERNFNLFTRELLGELKKLPDPTSFGNLENGESQPKAVA